MEQNQPSATAHDVAMHRAAHQLLDEPRVFEDPLALAIIGRDKASALRADPRMTETTRLSPYLRAFLAARSRLAEDELALAVRRGVSQYVILGAGLDTFAYRNPFPVGTLRVFEVDHPATQGWKRSLLAQAGIAEPPELRLTPLDFQDRTLAQGLDEAGFDRAEPAFFSWLGVTPYLWPEAVTATLEFIVDLPAGGGVVFDYAVSPALLGEMGRLAMEALTLRVGSAREPWLSFFEPQALERDLAGLGFSQVLDLDQGRINQLYFTGRADGLSVGTLYHLMKALV